MRFDLRDIDLYVALGLIGGAVILSIPHPTVYYEHARWWLMQGAAPDAAAAAGAIGCNPDGIAVPP